MIVTSCYTMLFTRHARDHRSHAVLKLNKTPLCPLPTGLMIRRGEKEKVGRVYDDLRLPVLRD